MVHISNRWLLALSCAGLCGLAATACGRASSDGTSRGDAVAAAAPPVVGVAPVERRTLSRTLQLAAEFKPYQDVAIDAKVAGYVQSMAVDVGDQVRAGQPLATLEVPELEDQIHQSAASVAQAKQGVARAQDLVNQAQADYQASHLDYTRLDQVMTTQPGLVAQQEVDDAHGKDQAAQAQVAAADASLDGARQQLAAAQADQQRLQTLFHYARITAPFAGVITKRFADVGAMIQAGTTQAMPIVQLAQEDVLRLGIPVPESAVPLVRIGMPAQVEVASLHQSFNGTVARFAHQVAFDTRTMYTEIDVPNPDRKLLPGMYAYATLVLQQAPNVLAVPVQAIQRQGTGASVLIVDAQHRLASVNVTLGLETPDAVQVTGGLQVGDQVVVSGGSLLRPGQAVTPKVLSLPTVGGAS